MYESELELLHAQFYKQTRKRGDFGIVFGRYHGVDDDVLAQLPQVSESFHHLFPRARRMHQSVVRFGTETVDGRPEFGNARGDELFHIVHIGKIAPVGLDLDFAVADASGVRHAFQKVGVHGRLAAGKYRTPATVLQFSEEYGVYLVARAGFVFGALVALYAKIAVVVAGESHFHVGSFHKNQKSIGKRYKYMEGEKKVKKGL